MYRFYVAMRSLRMRNIRTQLNALGVLILLLSGLVVVGVILNLYLLQVTYRQRTNATNLYVAVLEQVDYLRDYQDEPNNNTEQALVDTNERIKETINNLKQEFFVTSDERAYIHNIQLQYSAISLNFDILFPLSDQLHLTSDEHERIIEEIQDYVDGIQPNIVAFRDLIGKQRALIFSISITLFSTIFVILLLIGVLVFRMEHRLNRKFKELEQAARRLAGKNPSLAAAYENGPKDELKGIEQTISAAATRLEGNRRKLKELRELDVRKNEFISSASHELKTPLASLRIMAELLYGNAKSQSDKEAMDLTVEIKDEIDYMTRLINDMLDVTRLVSNKLTIYCKSFDMTDLVQKEIERFGSTFREHRIVFNPASLRTMVYADKERIKQVIGNLLSNAAKYSRPGTTIVVNVRKMKQETRVSIQDFGSGISPQDQMRIFEQFFRVERKEGGSAEGFGIGLYIARQIVELHGGTIWVKSKPGYGSTFYFTIPNKRVTEPAPEAEEEEASEGQTATLSFA